MGFAIVPIGIAVTLAAWGSSTAQAVSSQSACLLRGKELTAIFGGPALPPLADRLVQGKQSGCHYHQEPPGLGSLMEHVSWNKTTVTSFKLLHSGRLTEVHLPDGGTTPLPHYTDVSVAGTSAYWLPQAPDPSGSNVTTSTSELSALKNGHVVILTSTNLSESQDEQAMAVILHRL